MSEETRAWAYPPTIKIKRHHPDLIMPEYKPGSDWIDLRSAESVDFHKGDLIRISLGVSIRVTVILGGAAGSESPNGQVRLLHLPPIWSRSAVGSAPDLGSGGHQFESGRFHQLPGRPRLMCARPSSHTENENAR